MTDILTLTKDPVWPWSLSGVGMPALALVALVLIVLTLWTYWDVPRVSKRRVLALIILRLLALLMAGLVLLRPSLASRSDLRLPSTVLFLIDRSGSMTIQDEIDGQSRWDYMRQMLAKAEPVLQKLRDEHNVSVVMYAFAEDADDYDPNGKPDGKRTDFGKALEKLFGIYGRDRNIRALVVISDGADNGTLFAPVNEPARWRLPCPTHTFGVGKNTTADRQHDIAITNIVAAPSPVAIKGKLTVKGYVDAPGFVNSKVRMHLFFDDQEVMARDEILRLEANNEVTLVADAPTKRPKEGEIRVTLKLDPLPGELTVANNEISTYVAVTQEGLSVLLVDQPRYPEPQIICDALVPDPRIRVYPAWLRTDEASPDQAALFNLEKQHYDVIILGDLSAKRLSGGNQGILEKIQTLVKEQGAGLLMMGGNDSFGNSDWKGTPIEDALPVFLDVRGQVDGKVRIDPTAPGLGRFVMRLLDKSEDNKALWKELPELDGMTRLGKEKPGATILAVRAGSSDPILVSQDYGKGRTIAFACDTTWRWQLLGQPKSEKGKEAHARFWRQMVLWLAHQEEAEGSVRVKLDRRRLDAGEKLPFTVELRGKGGVQAKEAQFDATVVDPSGVEMVVATAAETDSSRAAGTFWKTDKPGEYRLNVRGRGKDADGQAIPEDRASARFVVSLNDTEMSRRAADQTFLANLAAAGGGKFYKAEDLVRFLKDLQNLPLMHEKPRTEFWPNWRGSTLSGFRVLFFLLFVGLLCGEWFCRRYWGLV
jgi:uncharacterized membrane protein